MDYSNFKKEELIEIITELEILNKELLKEKIQEPKLNFPWTGNLGQWYWNPQSNRVTFNPLKITTLGYGEDEIPEVVGFEFFTDKLHPEDYNRAMESMRDHLIGKSLVYELEYRIQAKDGSYKWYYDRGKITQYDKEGNPIFLSGIVFDITERKEKEKHIKEKNQVLFAETITDSLTNLKNRRCILDYLNMEINISCKKDLPLSMAVLDIDNFSRVNDTKGHIVGDMTLSQVAEIMSKALRESDFVGRYGGDEFIVIYPNTELNYAAKVTERIRKAIEEHSFDYNVDITISGGLSQYKGESLEEFINQADKNLYRAKEDGRNKVTF